MFFLLAFIHTASAQNVQFTSISPASTIAGVSDMTLLVFGSGFTVGSTVNWNGAPVATTFFSDTQLSAVIIASLIAQPGAASVSVTQSGIVTSGIVFQVLSPTATNITYSPALFTPGVDSTVTVNGSGFVPEATIFFDWRAIDTTYISPNQLSGAISGSQIANGPHHVYVYNATVPLGQASLQVQLSVGFGSNTVGTPSSQTMTITNTSVSNVTLGSPYFVISGTNLSDFVNPGTGSCHSSLILLPLNSCTINLTFTPTSMTAEVASLSLVSNGTGSPQFVALSGTGIGAAAPAFSASPSAVSFGSQVTGTTSVPITTTITNTGNADMTFSSLSIIGTSAADFAITGTGTCNGSITLTANSSCTVKVTFTPAGTATEAANIQVIDSAVGSPHTISLTGQGVAAGAHFVSLAWTATGSSPIVGYNVYRGLVTGGPYSLLTPSPIDSTSFNDTQVVHSTTYFYIVTTVGVNPPYSPAESIASNEGSATP